MKILQLKKLNNRNFDEILNDLKMGIVPTL